MRVRCGAGVGQNRHAMRQPSERLSVPEAASTTSDIPRTGEKAYSHIDPFFVTEQNVVLEACTTITPQDQTQNWRRKAQSRDLHAGSTQIRLTEVHHARVSNQNSKHRRFLCSGYTLH